MRRTRIICRVLGVTVLTGAFAWLGFSAISENQARAVAAAGSDRTLPTALARLAEAGPWVNVSLPLDLRGKVVLVNFWTYSCINSLRPLPYLRAWAEKYRNDGLVVVGVHAPEFGFEKDLDNVRHAAVELGVNYPVLLDRDLAVWRAFGNQGWPGFYFIDATGHVRDYRLGEGHYAESERLIQQLLAEAKGASISKTISAVDGKGAQAAPDWTDLGSPETYIGYGQSRNFSSLEHIGKDMPRQYRAPATMPRNHWNLGGTWSVGRESAELRSPSGTIGYRFHARDLHLVLGAAPDGRPVRFRVTIDGAAPGADHGTDTDEQGWGTVGEDRLYQLVRQARSVTDRNFEITFFAPGVRAYAFTFG
jgi:thiol-disulfide isomerase/thioredoxin